MKSTPELWRPEIAHASLNAPFTGPLTLPAWECIPYEIQSRGIGWLFATPRAILADAVGTGKTIHGVGLVALCREHGEISKTQKAIFVVTPSTVGQWQEEFMRFLPGCAVVTTEGLSKAERNALMFSPTWEVLITSYSKMFRDASQLRAINPSLVWFDEASSFKSLTSQTFRGAKHLAAGTPRVVCADATPIQNNLMDLYALLEVLGLAGSPGDFFRSEHEFRATYCIMAGGPQAARGGKIFAYKNMEGLVHSLTPFYLRRIEGSADMPDIAPPEDVWLGLTEKQRARYNEVVADPEMVTIAKLTYLMQATSTVVEGGDSHSTKLDWIMDFLKKNPTEKVVIFTRWLETVSALTARLAAADIGHGVIAGSRTAEERTELRHRFWNDPTCRVVVGTTAMERGMNLQVARYIILVDLMWNPSRIEQLVGRIRRSGSSHARIYPIRLLGSGTIEEGILRLLRFKAHLAGYVNTDESELFDALTPEEARMLIRPS